MPNLRPGHLPSLRLGAVTALTAAMVAAAPLAAQDAQPQAQPQPAAGQTTHTVKKGDTLWDIARQYLTDPFLWPEIYRLNTDVVEDPHWIYPGESLKIPGGAQMVAEDKMEAQPVAQPVDDSPRSPSGTTVFAASLNRGVRNTSRFGGSANLYPHTAVRSGEYYAAPWLDGPEGDNNKSGVLLASAEIPGIAMSSIRRRLLPDEEAYVSLPKDVVPTVGDHYLVYREGITLHSSDRVMVPTGIVEVESAEAGEATLVRIVEQFAYVESGDRVVPLDRFTLSADARPVPLLLGTEAKVVWVEDNSVLPTIQHTIILDATDKSGVKIGDQFTLYRPRTKYEAQLTGGEITIPEKRIALAQVVKVTPFGATAMIVSQEQPSIYVGSTARLTARMP